MHRERTPERRPSSRALPDISALAASPSKDERVAMSSAPLDALLQLVSSGHCVLAELLSLVRGLPPDLKLQAVTEGRFAAVLFDYRYFKDRQAVEQRIELSAQLTHLDEAFREAHGELLEQMYRLLERVVSLHASIQEFLDQLQRGHFIQCTLDTLFLHAQGKQLFCEALALFGAVLLALDRRLQGPVRERLVVAYHRLKGGSQAVGPSANAVIALCASTGLLPARRFSPPGYPEAYFARLPLPEKVVLRLVDLLRTDDIYNCALVFPAPEHRTCALASQASLLYLLLCFSPQSLHKNGSLMRTLVDRHFADNWVVAWGPGLYTDLAMEWDSFRAARAALAGVVTGTRAKDVAAAAASFLPECRSQLSAHLARGSLSEEYVLEHMSDILTTLRNGNATLRWLLLHSIGTHRKLRAAVAAAAPPADHLLGLLLDVAQLESEVKQVYGKLLCSKQERWQAQQAALHSSVSGLAKFFTALSKASLSDEDPPDFSVWFEHLHQQVDAMYLDDPGGSSRRVQGVVAALNELERFHSGEASLQTAHYLSVIRGHLAHLLRLADVRPAMLDTLGAVSDFAYGWGLLDTYVARFQAQIRKQPETVGKLSSLFQKAQSLMERPLLRLEQTKASHLSQVSQVYSATLLAFAQKVYQVIPGAMWELLDSMASIRTHRLQPLGSKIEVTALKDAAQLDQRAALVELAAQVAAFAEGIRTIDRAKVGALELEATKSLEDGLRQLLAMRIAGAGASLLSFPQAAVPLVHPSPFRVHRSGLAAVFGGGGFSGELPGRRDLSSRLAELSKRLDGLQCTFEDMQDFLGLPGLRIWHQQTAAVSAASLAKEETQMQSAAGKATSAQAPAELKPHAPVTLLGRVAGELLRLSSPKHTQYLPQMGAWEDASGTQVLGPPVLRLVGAALGGASLSALSRILGLRVQFCLEDVFANLTRLDAGTRGGLQVLENAASCSTMLQSSSTPDQALTAYSEAVKKCSGFVEPLLDALECVGQAQLLRQQLVSEIGSSFMLDGWSQLGESLSTLEDSVVSHLRLQATGPAWELRMPLDLEPFASLSGACGMEDALRSIYVDPVDDCPDLPALLFLALLSACSHLRYERSSGLLLRQHRHARDAAVLAVGATALLQQTPRHHLQVLLGLAGRWVQSYVRAMTGSVAQGVAAVGIQIQLPREVGTLLAFLGEMGRHGLVPKDAVSASIPFVYDTWLSLLD